MPIKTIISSVNERASNPIALSIGLVWIYLHLYELSKTVIGSLEEFPSRLLTLLESLSLDSFGEAVIYGGIVYLGLEFASFLASALRIGLQARLSRLGSLAAKAEHERLQILKEGPEYTELEREVQNLRIYARFSNGFSTLLQRMNAEKTTSSYKQSLLSDIEKLKTANQDEILALADSLRESAIRSEDEEIARRKSWLKRLNSLQEEIERENNRLKEKEPNLE